MELREKQYNDVHNQGAALLNQGHPAVHVIEVYLRTMQKQWDWLLSLAKCLEEHLRDALNLKSVSFFPVFFWRIPSSADFVYQKERR